MADHYSIFSEMIKDLSKVEKTWLQKVLAYDLSDEEEQDKFLGEMPQVPFSFDFDNYPGFSYKFQAEGLWLYAEEGYNEENLCNIISTFIKKFRPDYIFTCSIASYCSRPKIKEFGGAWLVISREGVEGGNTWSAADEEVDKILARRETTDIGPTTRRRSPRTEK